MTETITDRLILAHQEMAEAERRSADASRLAREAECDRIRLKHEIYQLTKSAVQ